MSEDQAKNRFLVIQAARLSGVVLALLGVAILAGKLGLPPVAGALLMLAGLIEALAVPRILARRWKSPPP